MASASWLDLQTIVDSTFNDLPNLIYRSGIGNSGGLRWNAQIVRLDMGKLEKRIACEHNVAHSVVETFLYWRAGLVSHGGAVGAWIGVVNEYALRG